MLFVHSLLYRYREKTVDIMYDIPFRRSLYTRYWYDIEGFIRYRIQYRIAISGYNDIKGKNFDVVHDIGAMSGYKDIDVFSSISKVWSILGTICHTWGGWAHRPRSSPADSDGSSLLVLDPLGRSVLLRDCLDAQNVPSFRRWRFEMKLSPFFLTVLTPFPAGVQQLLSVAAVARPWCGLPAGHGGQS